MLAPLRASSSPDWQKIAGTIGTGLFLGSGLALEAAGPLGALIVYGLVSTVAYASLCALGEMTSHAPISGTFPHYASRWVDPAYGFALGYVSHSVFKTSRSSSLQLELLLFQRHLNSRRNLSIVYSDHFLGLGRMSHDSL